MEIKRRLLDFALLERPADCGMFVRLPSEIEKAIETLQETSARFEGATKFCWYMSATPEVLYADEPKATRIREAFLRASLAEYVSVEDTLKRDLVKVGINEQAIRISD